MRKPIVCLNCGSSNLKEYREKNITEYRILNKDGTISKRKSEGVPDYNNPWGIICEDCTSLFDYELDDKERIIELFSKNERW